MAVVFPGLEYHVGVTFREPWALVSIAKLHILHRIPGHEGDSDSSHIKRQPGCLG